MAKANEITIWGIHLEFAPHEDPIKGGFIAIGWDDLGDLSRIAPNRDAFKATFAKTFPDDKAGAIPVKAGINFRFCNEMEIGDLVIYPSKADRIVHVGRIISNYEFNNSKNYSHRRQIKWLYKKPRAEFSQPALNEIGSAITLFKVSNNYEEFVAFAEGADYDSDSISAIDAETVEQTAIVTEEETRDYVVKTLHKKLTPDEFEFFIRDLLVAMGYFARVTKRNSQKHGDGGVDIIASRDELGFEPPVMKVECKRILSNKGREDIQKLIGTLEGNEVGLFVTLGGFSAEARILERSKPNIRLIDGEELAILVLQHYENLNAKYRNLIPLKRIYIPS